MNKPITSRVQQAVNGNRGVQEPLLHVGVATGNAAARKESPLKNKFEDELRGSVSKPRTDSQYSQAGIANNKKVLKQKKKKTAPEPQKSTGDIIASGGKGPTKTPKVKTDTAKTETKKDNSLVANAAKVGGTIKKAATATSTKPPASTAGNKNETVGDAVQANLTGRVESAGRRGKARRGLRAEANQSAREVRQSGGTRKEARQKRRGINTGSGELTTEQRKMYNTKRNIKGSGGGTPEKSTDGLIAAGRKSDASASRGFETPQMSKISLEAPNLTRSSTPSKPESKEDNLFRRLDTEGKLGAPIKMLNSNVGVKSRSPMKKGYFKGM